MGRGTVDLVRGDVSAEKLLVTVPVRFSVPFSGALLSLKSEKKEKKYSRT